MPTGAPQPGLRSKQFASGQTRPLHGREAKEKWAPIQKVPTLARQWSTSMQMRNPHPHSLIGPGSTALMAMELLRLVSKDANEDTAA